MIGGYQAGYNWQLTNSVVLGVEADVSFGSPVDIPRLAPAPFNTTINYIATGRGRLGYAMGTWMPYVTGGVAWGSTHVGLNDFGAIVPPKRYLTHVGWTAGLGIEVAVGGNWTAKAEYDYVDLARRTYDLDRCWPAACQCRSERPPVQARAELPPVGNPALGRAPRSHAAKRASRTGELECSRPDHGHHAGLSAHAIAL